VPPEVQPVPPVQELVRQAQELVPSVQVQRGRAASAEASPQELPEQPRDSPVSARAVQPVQVGLEGSVDSLELEPEVLAE
jgi:hypothetical protein